LAAAGVIALVVNCVLGFYGLAAAPKYATGHDCAASRKLLFAKGRRNIG
jgi:hypothetical protein